MTDPRKRFPLSLFVLYFLGVLLIGLFSSNKAHAGTDRWSTSAYPSYVDSACLPGHSNYTDWAQCVADAYTSGNGYWTGGGVCSAHPARYEITIPPYEIDSDSWAFQMRVLRYAGNSPEDCGNNGDVVLSSSTKTVNFTLTTECTASESFNPSTGMCENTQSCDGQNIGQRETLPFEPGTIIPSQGICDTSSGCNYTPTDSPFCHSDTVSGAQTCTITLQKTGDSCTLPDNRDMGSNPDGSKCASINGDLFCKDNDDPNDGLNCGYVNDQYICLGSVPDGDCIFFGDGGMACDSDASSPPAPDNGTPGNTATPDNQLSDGTDTTDLFDPSTVAGSSGTPTGNQGNQDPNGNDVTGGDEGDDGDDGTGTASGDCNVPPVCSGDAIQCAILEQEWRTGCQDVGTEGDILSQTGLSETPSDLEGTPIDLGTELDDAGWLGAGECLLDITVDLGFFGVVNIPLSNWCPLFAFLGLLVMASAGIISLRIIAGAF